MSKKLIILIILVLMGSLVIAGCTTSTTTENKTATATATANATKTANVTTGATAATGNKIAVAANQNFTIRLRSNPSTGYRWQESYDHTYVSLVNKTFVSDPHPSGAVGVGGYDVYTFKAVKVGTTTIRFDYYCPAHTLVNSTTYTIVIT
jgi:inhibitor of cysteine peptidase